MLGVAEAVGPADLDSDAKDAACPVAPMARLSDMSFISWANLLLADGRLDPPLFHLPHFRDIADGGALGRSASPTAPVYAEFLNAWLIGAA